MKTFTTALFISLYGTVFAQNVGIGNPSPTEKLDVTGNINVTGTIKANGVSGAQNQVLTTNATGNLAWTDACEYKNFESISSTSATTWVPPVGVTKILVECWGAGGGGNMYAGGGGGGYIKAIFELLPTSTISLGIGNNGIFSNGAADATAGSNTFFTVTNNGVDQTITAFGGGGGLYGTATLSQAGYGGAYSRSSNVLKYIGLEGESGYNLDKIYYQVNATTFYEKGIAGRGGNAANSTNTGGLGASYIVNPSDALIQAYSNPKVGKIPGGGGSGGYFYNTTSTSVNSSGGNGADGLIIIRY
jgi:trimeric autotransporter adhesin